MRKIFLTLLFCLFTLPCFAQTKISTLQKVSGKGQYETTLGTENDLVKIGKDTDTVALSPRIEFSKWNGEEKLSIEYEGLSALTPTIENGIVKIEGAKEGFYFDRNSDDVFKFGLILSETPKNTDTWTFRLSGWENFTFEYQRPLANVNSDGSTWKNAPIGNGGICKRSADLSGGYVIFHKWKANHEIGKINYGDGQFGWVARPKLIDAGGKFIGFPELSIREGEYTLSIANIPQKTLDEAKLPLTFNDQYGLNTVGTELLVGSIPLIIGWNLANAPAGQITAGYIAAKVDSGTRHIRMDLYTGYEGILIANTDTGSITLTRTTDPTNTLSTWANNSIASGFTLVATTTYYPVVSFDYANTSLYYNEVVGTLLGYSDTVAYASFPSAGVSLYTGDSLTWKISACYEYTAGGGGGTTSGDTKDRGIARGIMRGVFR